MAGRTGETPTALYVMGDEVQFINVWAGASMLVTIIAAEPRAPLRVLVNKRTMTPEYVAPAMAWIAEQLALARRKAVTRLCVEDLEPDL